MKSTDAPSKQAVPFGTNGPREAITPTTPSGSNQASYDQGFPPITMTLKSAGGLPPKGQDMNQILFEQSSFNRYFAAGGGYSFDSAFSTAISGYPKGSRLTNSSGNGFWLNINDDNTINPENNNSATTGWVPDYSYGITNLTGVTASTSMSTLDASKSIIILNGTLTANINLAVPAWVKQWIVINQCAGNFSVTVKTPAGTGVSIPNGQSDYIYGDGTNVYSIVNLLGLSGGSALPIGTPIPWGSSTPPSGWINMQGQTISQTQYPRLFAIYGASLPDLRGEFIRGWDNGRGADTGRAMLSSQRGSILLKDTSDSVASFSNAAGDTNTVLDWDATQRTDSVVINTTVRQTTTVQPVNNTSYMGISRPRNIAFNYIVRGV